jgi:serine/threonine protein kinase
LSHPNILTVYDLVQLEGRTALVTEYVAGRDLADGFEANHPLSHRSLVEVVGQVASALLAAWDAHGPEGPLRLVHRDVKPSNIRVGDHGQVRLLDFGIAYFLDPARESETTSHVIMGSLPYMSPERFLDDRRASASDVFGLGCCLFEGLAKVRFHETADFGTLSALALNPDHFDAHLAVQRARLEGADPALTALVLEMLSRDPDQRPSLVDLVARLETWQEGAQGERLRAWCRAQSVAEDEEPFGAWVGNTLEEGAPLVNETLPPLLESARIALTRIATGETSRLLAPDSAVVRWWTRAWRWLLRRRWPVLISGAGCFVVLGLALGLIGFLVIGGFSVAWIVS